MSLAFSLFFVLLFPFLFYFECKDTNIFPFGIKTSTLAGGVDGYESAFGHEFEIPFYSQYLFSYKKAPQYCHFLHLVFHVTSWKKVRIPYRKTTFSRFSVRNPRISAAKLHPRLQSFR